MNLYLAQHLAIALMKQHGLSDWRFTFDHARRRFGSCQPTRKRLTLSRHLTFLNTEEQVRDTILHEIAHALCPADGHGSRWKAMCRKIGAKPERCYASDEVITPPKRPAPFQIGCPRCDWWSPRHKRITRKLVCRHCRTEVVLRGSA